MDDDHSVAVYNSSDGSLISSNKGSRAKTLSLATFEDKTFCTSGKKEMKFWTLNAVKGEVSDRSERALMKTSILATKKRNGYRHNGYIHY